MGISPEQAYKEREKRVNDAIQLQKPDRVPFFPGASYFAAKYAGMGNVVKIKPPLVFSADDAARLVAALDRVLAEDFVAHR